MTDSYAYTSIRGIFDPPSSGWMEPSREDVRDRWDDHHRDPRGIFDACATMVRVGPHPPDSILVAGLA